MEPRNAVVLGTLKPDGTLELDEKPALAPGRVRVVLHPEAPSDSSKPSLIETLEQIHKDLEASGFKGYSKEELDAQMEELRDDSEYQEKWRRIYEGTIHPLPPGEKY